MFLSRIKTNNVYPCKPQFYYIKVGFKGVKIKWVCFRDVLLSTNCSIAIPLLQFLFVCASVVSYVAFVLSLFVPYLSLFLCLGETVS